MKKQIVNISVMQTAKVMAVLYFVMSLPFVAIAAIPTLLAPSATRAYSLGMLVAMPVLYVIFGFIFTAIGAWVYNMVAGKMGGFEFTTTDVAAH